MRKITKQAVAAFNNGIPFKQGNTEVLHRAMTKDGQYPKGDRFVVMELHGNEIARRDSATGQVEISNAGWESNTTKERLNGLGAGIHQSNFVWYKDGEKFPSNQWVKL